MLMLPSLCCHVWFHAGVVLQRCFYRGGYVALLALVQLWPCFIAFKIYTWMMEYCHDVALAMLLFRIYYRAHVVHHAVLAMMLCSRLPNYGPPGVAMLTMMLHC